MQTNEITQDGLRRLAALKPSEGKVLSVFVNLDPSSFATAQARSTQVRSLLDEAERRIKAEELAHADQAALREDVERLRSFLGNGSFSAKGAHGLAVFCCGPADLFEVIKLPRPVEATVVIDDSPFVEPLVDMGPAGRWCVLLVNRKAGRILRGSPERLEEVEVVWDDVHGQHDQGGWSQARYQRGVEKEVQDHVKRVAEELFRSFQRTPFDRLLIGSPEEMAGDVEGRLHPYLRDRLAGRIEVDVEHANADDVRAAAAPLIKADDRRREREALDRLEEGLGAGGRAAAGLDDVLSALNERRVESLLIAEGWHAPGVVCPQDGWMGVAEARCPLDDVVPEERDDIVE
ncbi:MAG: host attachment protein, partial [Actinobacteria bacterium]|nr:host attachment protein [Actinomycetota bacterium]